MSTPKTMQCINTLINTGIKNLKIFGYQNVTIHNICSDQVYRSMFYRMLKETYEQLPEIPVSSENIQSIKNYRNSIIILQRKINNNGGNIL